MHNKIKNNTSAVRVKDDRAVNHLIRRIKMCEKKISITELGNPRKPQGEAGIEMLEGMNKRHYAVTGWALDFFEFRDNDTVLDIGCGGGETLHRLSELIEHGKIYGVDYSELSVKLSTEKNKSDVDSGKVSVLEASVETLPFESCTFDKIITIESFYFWPDHAQNLKEVYRVLKNGGRFLIVADINGDAHLNEDDIDGIKKFGLFNPTLEQFRQLLISAGFKDVAIHTKNGEKWVCAEGNK